MFPKLTGMACATCALVSFASAPWAKTAVPHSAAAKRKADGPKMVAYDAKDKRYYSVAWARAHGMHDKGGDPLTVVSFQGLPKDARESKAMKGAKI